MSEYFPKPRRLGGNMKVELDVSNYATKADLRNATGFAKKSWFSKLYRYDELVEKVNDIQTNDASNIIKKNWL